MSIEIKEMVVKTMVDRQAGSNHGRESVDLSRDFEKLKTQILTECKEMFQALQDEQAER